jgi:tRNA G10  N-methylase Trm11
MLKNNLGVYGKGFNLVNFMNKDALDIQPYAVDAVLIFPPWGGPSRTEEYSYRDIDEIMVPKLSEILNHFKKFSKNMVLQMPKNTNIKNILKIINLCYINPIIKI